MLDRRVMHSQVDGRPFVVEGIHELPDRDEIEARPPAHQPGDLIRIPGHVWAQLKPAPQDASKPWKRGYGEWWSYLRTFGHAKDKRAPPKRGYGEFTKPWDEHFHAGSYVDYKSDDWEKGLHYVVYASPVKMTTQQVMPDGLLGAEVDRIMCSDDDVWTKVSDWQARLFAMGEEHVKTLMDLHEVPRDRYDDMTRGGKLGVFVDKAPGFHVFVVGAPSGYTVRQFVQDWARENVNRCKLRHVEEPHFGEMPADPGFQPFELDVGCQCGASKVKDSTHADWCRVHQYRNPFHDGLD